tara:strand:+ start:122 stop:559 length:438 start_codon:yes stop_codon:yes gene_type:complete
MELLIEIPGWFFMSIVKFVVTAPLMLSLGYSPVYVICVNSASAVIGVHLFYNLGKVIFDWIDRVKTGKTGKKSKQIVTKSKRRLVAFKNKFGLKGLLFIAGLISVPISAVLVSKWFRNESGGIWWLSLAFVVWSIVLTFGTLLLI